MYICMSRTSVLAMGKFWRNILGMGDLQHMQPPINKAAIHKPLQYSLGKTFNDGLSERNEGKLPNYYPVNNH